MCQGTLDTSQSMILRRTNFDRAVFSIKNDKTSLFFYFIYALHLIYSVQILILYLNSKTNDFEQNTPNQALLTIFFTILFNQELLLNFRSLVQFQ